MTKLTPIDTLVIKAGIVRYDGEAGCMEAIRQAIIRDFVSKLEPVHSQFFDVNKWYDYLNEKHKKNTIEAGYLHRDLYDLSEWSK